MNTKMLAAALAKNANTDEEPAAVKPPSKKTGLKILTAAKAALKAS